MCVSKMASSPGICARACCKQSFLTPLARKCADNEECECAGKRWVRAALARSAARVLESGRRVYETCELTENLEQ